MPISLFRRKQRTHKERQYSKNDLQQEIERKEAEQMEHQRKAQAKRWLRNFRNHREEIRQENIRIEAEQSEQQRNIETRLPVRPVMNNIRNKAEKFEQQYKIKDQPW